jgi:hypothetical protein
MLDRHKSIIENEIQDRIFCIFAKSLQNFMRVKFDPIRAFPFSYLHTIVSEKASKHRGKNIIFYGKTLPVFK